MRDLKCEKSPGADLPFSINMATGDMAAVYATDAIAAVVTTDWAGNPLAGIAVTNSFSGSTIVLRISGGTVGQTYQIKAAATLTNPNYVDEVFLTLYVRQPAA